MSKWCNNPEVMTALHATSQWTSTDEVGPVAIALKEDMEQGFVPLIEHLIDSGIKWLM